ncbi:MAG: ATP-binding protein [Chloroflexi bacterium]|nr:ATP-binding protein [Chloroflexota bacterium]
MADGARAGDRFGDVQNVDRIGLTIDIKKRVDAREFHPKAVFAHTVIESEPLEKALLRLARWVNDHGIDNSGPYRAARDLLLRRPPRLITGTTLIRHGESPASAAVRLGLLLDGGVLPIQGPPGSGKTTTGARMICELVGAGKKVGITAVSHAVIRNLLEKTIEVAQERGIKVQCVQKVNDLSDEAIPAISEVTDNGAALEMLWAGQASIGAGTAWLWSRPEAFDAVDVLFVDEAGQMSLANVLAVSQAARSVVLLGDPQQLEQPQQGSHPDGTDVSALQHLLGDARTIPADRGLFLDETWRLSPEICSFTSELFYDARLKSRAGLEAQRIEGETRFEGAGLWYAPVEHDGNQSSSPEEADRVAEIFREVTSGRVSWVDASGKREILGASHVLIVVPYNAQVTEIGERIPEARVGTVDKFQGQEAPVVIYSMATSSPEDAPRGMEFLYSLNRLNVATSRARCACILVASPRLFEPECRTPRQIQLANAFCRYLEMANSIGALIQL